MIKYRLLWTVDRTKDERNAPLQFRVKWNGSKCIATFSPKVTIDATKWSQEAQRCNANTTHTSRLIPANIINKRLGEYEAYAKQAFDYFDGQGINPNVSQFKHAFNVLRREIPMETEPTSMPFSDAMQDFIDRVQHISNWSANTLKSINGTKNTLAEFDPKLRVDDLTYDKLAAFLTYLTDKGYKNTYIRKVFKNLLEVMRWMESEGIYHGDAHKTFKPRFKGAYDYRTVIYLTWEELMHVYNMTFDDINLERTRDAFCFCCFTSLRYSDLVQLQRCDVKPNHIEIVTAKTDEVLRIDLNDYSRALLNKYAHADWLGTSALPVYANQVMNRYLKEIAKQAGLTQEIKTTYYSGNKRVEEVHKKYELITTHCGRRTFIVNALFLGIPAEVVMKWTGHEDYKAMKPYIAIVDKLKSQEMNKFNTFGSRTTNENTN